MHHATTAGSHAPTPAQSDSARWPKTQSLADGRQALAEINLNQPSLGLQTSPQTSDSLWQKYQSVEHKQQQVPWLLESNSNQSSSGIPAGAKSTKMAWQPHQSVLQYGSALPADIARAGCDLPSSAAQSVEKHLTLQLERQQQTGQAPQQSVRHGVEQRHDASSRQNKHFRWADADRQLRQGGEQPAISSCVSGATDRAVLPNIGASHRQLTSSIQHDPMGASDCVPWQQDQDVHAEELQVLAQLLEPTRAALPQRSHSQAYPLTAQDVTPRSRWKAPQTDNPYHDAGIAGSSSSGLVHFPEARQDATEVLRHTGSALTAPEQLAFTNHQARQQLSPVPYDDSLAMIGNMHHQARLAGGGMHDLPAGIPLTPVQVQQPHPRDSLEASIWKLSGSGQHKTAGLRGVSAVRKAGGHSPR
ncbi:hypothetical protein ABBQ32_006003 [Trebouxia sp. C0010 RCD-2024]